jgi:hypothetical protein
VVLRAIGVLAFLPIRSPTPEILVSAKIRAASVILVSAKIAAASRLTLPSEHHLCPDAQQAIGLELHRVRGDDAGRHQVGFLVGFELFEV